MVRALASHECGPGSTPGVDAICGLSLLMVLPFAPRGFSLGTLVFPSPQKPTLPNAKSIWNARTRLNGFKWTTKCFVGNKAIYIYIYNPLSPSTSKKKIKPSTIGLFWTNSVSWNNGNGDYRKPNGLCQTCFCCRSRRHWCSFPP